MVNRFDRLLSHFTYDIFAAHWPNQNDIIGELFNRINKYVSVKLNQVKSLECTEVLDMNIPL